MGPTPDRKPCQMCGETRQTECVQFGLGGPHLPPSERFEVWFCNTCGTTWETWVEQGRQVVKIRRNGA